MLPSVNQYSKKTTKTTAFHQRGLHLWWHQKIERSFWSDCKDQRTLWQYPPAEARPDHRRRGSYPPLPPRLNPSPNPLTMASKLLNSNGSKSSKEARKKAEAKTRTATTKSHQITARSSGTLEWPCPPIFQVAVRTPKPRETERFLLGARWLLGSGGAGNNFYGAQAQRPRPILLASLIESAPNCAAANWDSVLPLYEVSFSSPFSKSCEVKPVDGLSNFLFLAVIDVYSREMMRT